MSRRQRRTTSRPQAIAFSSSESESNSDSESDTEYSSDPEPDALYACDDFFDDDDESDCDPQVVVFSLQK